MLEVELIHPIHVAPEKGIQDKKILDKKLHKAVKLQKYQET